MTQYIRKPHTYDVTQIDKPPQRQGLTSAVYMVDGKEFVAQGMPCVGDYLLRFGALYRHISKVEFENEFVEYNG